MFQFILSALWQWVLGRFGLSTEQKLGRLEEKEAQEAQTLKEVQLAKEVQDSVDALRDDDVVRQLRAKYPRK